MEIRLLQVLAGRGIVGIRDGAAQAIRAGDLVYAPPNEEHWHGAAEETVLVTRAVSLGVTEWLEPVGDDRYRGSAGDGPQVAAGG